MYKEKFDEKVNVLIDLINKSKNIVFFGGAGVSTESGIPDFRSKDGIYNMKFKYSPEYMLSHTFFVKNTKEFYDFYRAMMDSRKYLPNITHKVLKKMEDNGNLKAVITQNIDGLHEKAGSKKVYNLHGNIYENKCMKCGKMYDAKSAFDSLEVPKCSCGGIIKPEVVLYEEGLDDEVVNGAIKKLREADLLIVGGTSLTVYPANTFIALTNAKNIVIINKDRPNLDYIYLNPAFLDKNIIFIESSLGKVFEKVDKII